MEKLMKTLFFALLLCVTTSYSFAEDYTIDGLLKDRVLGDANAPVTLVDHSSLTCPHCKTFHTDSLPKIISNFVDTGKVKILFSDYPLNAPALQGSMIARCIKDDDTYFKYIDFLFETQDTWAYAPDPRAYLAQNARLLGISSEDLDSCMKTPEYQEAFIKKIQADKEMKNIQSTPTFIVAETGEVITGAKPYIVFESSLNSALKHVGAKEE